MQLGFKGNDLATAKNIRLVKRVALTLDDYNGIEAINQATDLRPLSVNICATKPQNKLLPTDKRDYHSKLAKAIKLIEKLPPHISVENEVYAYRNFNYDFNSDAFKMYIDLVLLNYKIWHPLGVKVSHCGTACPTSAAITEKYIREVLRDNERADDFVKRWSGSAFNPPVIPIALHEIDLYRKAGVTDMLYTLHLHVTPENVTCIPDIIEAMKYYTKDIGTIGFNELTFSVQDANLVHNAMRYISSRVKFVIAYTDNATMLQSGAWWTKSFTPEMEAAFLAFA